MIRDVAIIGAGISGANLAAKLRAQGFKVTVFEKARGPGGRTSTRRFQNEEKTYRIDHGAQYIDVLDDSFQAFIDELEKEAIVEKFTKLGSQKTYVAIPAMNALAKFLMKDIDAKYATKAASVVNKGSKNVLLDENDDELGEFDLIISTAPPKQTAELFTGFREFDFLNDIEMKAHFAIMLISSKKHDFGFTEMHIEDKDSLLNWIGINSEKPGRGDDLGIIMHTNFKWTLNNLDTDRDLIADLAVKELKRKTGFEDSEPVYKACHRWLYGRTLEPIGRDFIFDEKNHLACCGDYMLGDNIEAAFLSSSRLAEHLLQKA